MPSFYFGKTIQFAFYPLSEDGLNHQSLPAMPISAHIFDTLPSEAEAAAGTGAIESVGVWTDTPDRLGKYITFAPILNSSDSNEATYYIAINLELQPTFQIEPIIREITIKRLQVQDSILDIPIHKLLRMEPKILMYCKSIPCLYDYIESAIEDVKMRFSGCDFDWTKVKNPEQFCHSTAKLAIAKFFYGESMNPNDSLWHIAERYYKESTIAMAALQVVSDSNKDGIADGTRKGNGGTFKTFRVTR